MTYQAIADLADDVPFARRVTACLSVEAQGKTDYLAEQIMRSPSYGTSWFMPFLASAPGFADAYSGGGQTAIDDGMILSAVQASWGAVSALHPEPEPTP